MRQKVEIPVFERSSSKSSPAAAEGLLDVFPTELGWFGLWGSAEIIRGLTIGHATADDVRLAVTKRCRGRGEAVPVEQDNWFNEPRSRLERYARGLPVEFADLPIQLPVMTRFQRRVLKATRRIGYGCTLTYGELAEQAGAPRAARAVGNVMAGNRIPILIPCHRVVASGGRWGGFSAPQGVDLKRRMLQMEAETVERPPALPDAG